MQSLEGILGSRNKIKLIRFLAQARAEDWQFNLAEISRQVGMDKGAISKLIKELEQKKILLTKRSGKLLMFRLNHQNKIISQLIVPFFEKEVKIK
jgi:DNA-binding MarR family transcriptional regulator